MKNIREVAKIAGVSAATISRVTNGRGNVDKELAKRVWEAVAALGYSPNPQARALGSRRSRTLGLLVSEISNPFYPELIQSFEDIAGKDDYEVMVSSTNYNPERARLFIKRLVQKKVEGVAVITFRAESPLLDELIAAKIPLVSVTNEDNGPCSLYLEIDYGHGIHQAVQHLAALGHRRIAFIAGPLIHASNLRRQEGFLRAIQSVGIQARDSWMYEGDHTFEAGMGAATHFLRVAQRPTAIVSSNDLMAVGVLRRLAEQQVKVPREMSVVGFDDIHLAKFVTPALTTVRLSRKKLAQAAFDGIQILMNKKKATEHHALRVVTSLVVRESTDFHAAAAQGLNLKRQATTASSAQEMSPAGDTA